LSASIKEIKELLRREEECVVNRDPGDRAGKEPVGEVDAIRSLGVEGNRMLA
jgi:hypothetical protein